MTSVIGPQPALNNHNVYILGAGFSSDRGLPLMRDFFDRLRDAVVLADTDRERQAISDVIKYRISASSAAERVSIDPENIEDLFSLASLQRASKIYPSIATAICATIHSCAVQQLRPGYSIRIRPWEGIDKSKPHVRRIANRFQIVNQTNDEAVVEIPLYSMYLATMLGELNDSSHAAKNTILTFNYDTVVEEALTSLGYDIDYGLAYQLRRHDNNWIKLAAPSTARSVQLLKLHGSMNWTLAASEADTEGVGVLEWPEIARQGLQPLVVPPVWNKNISGPLDSVWEQAVQALGTATRIAVVGSSLSSADGYFKYLLAAGMKDNPYLRSIAFVGQEEQVYDGNEVSFYTAPNGRTSHGMLAARTNELLRAGAWRDNRSAVFVNGIRSFVRTELAEGNWGRNWSYEFQR